MRKPCVSDVLSLVAHVLIFAGLLNAILRFMLGMYAHPLAWFGEPFTRPVDAEWSLGWIAQWSEFYMTGVMTYLIAAAASCLVVQGARRLTATER